jgi:O-antigen ligase
MTSFVLGRRAGGRPGLDREVLATLGLGLAVALVAAAAAVLAGPMALAIPVAIAVLIFLVREPLALLTLYVYIGLFKEEAIVQAIPFDATVGLGLLLGAVCFARLVSGRGRPVPYLLALALAVVGICLVVSLGWSPSPEYGGEKTEKYLTLTLLAALAPFFLIEDESDLRRLGIFVVGLGVIAAGLAVASPPRDNGRLEVGAGASTIGVSRLLCTAAIILLLGALGNARARMWAVGGGLGLIVTAAAVGSRGPLLSLALALAATAAVWLLRAPRKVWPVLAVVVAGLAVTPFVSLPEASSRRLAAVTNDPVAAFERDARSLLYREAVQLIDEHMLRGAGAGAFESVNRARYPHNIFLELWAELGFVAMAVVAATIIAALLGLYRTAWRLPEGRARRFAYIVTGVFLFYFFAVQVSGDINDNREFWVALSVAWLVVRHGVRAPPTAAEPAGRA